MFTGIVLGTAKITEIIEEPLFRTHRIEFPEAWLLGLETGASVAHNGCCLTVTSIENNTVSFDLIKETLRVTNLGQLTVGDEVNIERAARFSDEIGGHLMSGHIITQASIVKIIETEHNKELWFELDNPELMKYILHKGFIGIDGCSLTLGEVTNRQFCVYLIPETLERTLFGQRKLDEKVNIEIDPQTQAIVDTVERMLKKQSQ